MPFKKIKPALGEKAALLAALFWSGLLLFSAPGAASGRAAHKCLIIADADQGEIIFRHGPCGQRFTPASTFKLPLALMGFETGILKSEHQPAWRCQPKFEADQKSPPAADPASWLQKSVIWYSRQITRRLGQERLEGYLALFDYGNMDISGDLGQNNGLERAWLSSSLQISPDEQTEFIRRFLKKQLGLSDQAYQLTEAIIPRFETGGWVVRGKTGSGWQLDAKGRPDHNQPLGWFVGWAEKGTYRAAFACLEIYAQPTEIPASLLSRDHLLADLPLIMGEP